MADARDLILAEKPRIGTPSVARPIASRLKLLLRRTVVATAFPPLSSLYALVYRAHIWYARRTLQRMPGVRSAYVARGAASSDTVPGVSDIDLLVFGDWTEAEQAEFEPKFRRLLAMSPLYDHTAGQVNTIQSLQALYRSDYFFQFRFDWARRQSRLLLGEDVLAALPPVDPNRARGGYWMELKLLWMFYMTSAFGSGPTASDRIFRNSIAVKTVAGFANMERAFETGELEHSRSKMLTRAVEPSDAAERRLLERMLHCLKSRYQRYEGDVGNDSLWFLLHAAERMQAAFPGQPPFDSVAGARFFVDAPAEEVFYGDATRPHVSALVDHAERHWRGFRRAYLLPRSSFAGLDELQLLIDVNPEQAPSVDQVRALCEMHVGAELAQRVALYLLLPEGAYLLERSSPLEFWQVLLTPTANPETFALLDRAEFVVAGAPRPTAELRWTNIASTQIRHELSLRRNAMGKAAGAGAPSSPLHLVRAVWRQLQLEVVERSLDSGDIRFPLTVPAVRRGMQSWGLPSAPILDDLELAYQSALRGDLQAAADVIPRAVSFFMQFQKPETQREAS